MGDYDSVPSQAPNESPNSRVGPLTHRPKVRAIGLGQSPATQDAISARIRSAGPARLKPRSTTGTTTLELVTPSPTTSAGLVGGGSAEQDAARRAPAKPRRRVHRDRIRPAVGGGSSTCELWQYRELLLFLIWRDLKVGTVRRYSSHVGCSPAGDDGGRVRSSSGDSPASRQPASRTRSSLAGLLPWLFFMRPCPAGNSVVASKRLVTKIYFPGWPSRSPRSGGGSRFSIAVGCWGGDGLAASGPAAESSSHPDRRRDQPRRVGFRNRARGLNVRYRDFRYVIPFWSVLDVRPPPFTCSPEDASGVISVLIWANQ